MTATLQRWPAAGRTWLSSLTREARDTLWLLAMLALVLLPHAPRLPWWCNLSATGALVWRAWLAKTDSPLPSRWLLALLLVASLAMTWLTHRSLIGRDAGITLVVILTTLKSLELRARRDSLVCLYLGFFLILTQFFYSQSIGTALLMLVAVWGLLCSLILGQRPHGRPSIREVGRESAKAMLYGLPLMVLLFLLFPRIGPLWSLPSDVKGRTGLSNDLTLGQVAELAQDGGIALRVRFIGAAPDMTHLYFRGPTLDQFDGKQWRPTPALPGWNPDYTLAGTSVSYQITIEPQNLNVLPLLDGTGQAKALVGAPDKRLLRKGAQWSLAGRRQDQRLQLDAVAWPRAFEGPREDSVWLREWVALPPGFNPKTLAWAAQFRQQPGMATADAMTLAQAVLRHIRTGGYSYTLAPGLPEDPNERHLIDDFWLNQKAGFCEHFATAFVVVMRAMDIPSRVVTGYQGAELNPVDGQYIVRNSNAHAWAEVWVQGLGWTRVDPTAAVAPERIVRPPNRPPLAGLPGALGHLDPAALRRLRATWEAIDHRWNVWVLQYSQGQQMRLMQSLGWGSPNWGDLGRLMGWVFGLVGLASALLMWLSKERQHRTPWQRLLRRVDEALAEVHAHRPPGPQPAPASSWLRHLRLSPPPALSQARQDVLQRHLMALDALQYGGSSGPDRPATHARQALSLVKQIEQLCRTAKGQAPQAGAHSSP